MKTAFSIVFLLACSLLPATPVLAHNNMPTHDVRTAPRVHHHHNWRRHRHYARHRHHRRYRVAHRGNYGVTERRGHGISLAGQPHELVVKVQELIRDCGARIISGNRPGARVAGTGHISNHALNMADDVTGPPECLYAHLKGWPGGYSTDYNRVHHVHISFNRQKEWGVRFVHGGGYRHYAHRHLRYARQ